MKRVFGIAEAVFDIFYLLAAAIIGCILLFSGEMSAVRMLSGIMAVVLFCGDAFHLLPRIAVVLTRREDKLRVKLGRGKQITSITMTIYYLLLWEIGKSLFVFEAEVMWSAIIYMLAAVRIFLCILPHNRWTDSNPPVKWGIVRNIPFLCMGILTAACFFVFRFDVIALQWMWLAVLLSFVFYLPVVLWAYRAPKLGMLMLPKTCMYLWMLTMFLAM